MVRRCSQAPRKDVHVTMQQDPPETTSQRTYRTSDLAVIAYLRASGRLRFLRYDRANPKRIAAIFADPESVGYSIRDSFDRGECAIDAHDYHSTLRGVHREIEDERAVAKAEMGGQR